MEASEAKVLEPVEVPSTVSIDTKVITDAWSLIASREWPVSMISAVAYVKHEFERSIKESQVEKDKSSD